MELFNFHDNTQNMTPFEIAQHYGMIAAMSPAQQRYNYISSALSDLRSALDSDMTTQGIVDLWATTKRTEMPLYNMNAFKPLPSGLDMLIPK